MEGGVTRHLRKTMRPVVLSGGVTIQNIVNGVGERERERERERAIEFFCFVGWVARLMLSEI